MFRANKFTMILAAMACVACTGSAAGIKLDDLRNEKSKYLPYCVYRVGHYRRSSFIIFLRAVTPVYCEYYGTVPHDDPANCSISVIEPDIAITVGPDRNRPGRSVADPTKSCARWLCRGRDCPWPTDLFPSRTSPDANAVPAFSLGYFRTY